MIGKAPDVEIGFYVVWNMPSDCGPFKYWDRWFKKSCKREKCQDKVKLKTKTSTLSFAVSPFETVKRYIIEEDDKMIVISNVMW